MSEETKKELENWRQFAYSVVLSAYRELAPSGFNLWIESEDAQFYKDMAGISDGFCELMKKKKKENWKTEDLSIEPNVEQFVHYQELVNRHGSENLEKAIRELKIKKYDYSRASCYWITKTDGKRIFNFLYHKTDSVKKIMPKRKKEIIPEVEKVKMRTVYFVEGKEVKMKFTEKTTACVSLSLEPWEFDSLLESGEEWNGLKISKQKVAVDDLDTGKN